MYFINNFLYIFSILLDTTVLLYDILGNILFILYTILDKIYSYESYFYLFYIFMHCRLFLILFDKLSLIVLTMHNIAYDLFRFIMRL